MTREISYQKARSVLNEGGWDAVQSGFKICSTFGENVVIWAKNPPHGHAYNRNMKTIYYLKQCEN